MTQPLTHTVRVIDSNAACPELPLIEGKGYAKVVLWPGNGAKFRSIQVLSFEGGDQTIELSHSTDCVYGVVRGEGMIVDLADSSTQQVSEGNMLHIDATDRYRLIAGQDGMVVVGGPCPPDPALYQSLHRLGSAEQ